MTPNFYTGAVVQAQVVATKSGAVYTGLALASNATGNFLFAANNTGSIDVFDKSFHADDPCGPFHRPVLARKYDPL